VKQILRNAQNATYGSYQNSTWSIPICYVVGEKVAYNGSNIADQTSRASSEGLQYFSLMSWYGKPFLRSLCSINHRYYHKCTKTASL